MKWKPYYRIIEKKGPVSYVIKNHGSTSHVHAESLRHANIDEWDMEYHKDSRLKDATLAVPMQDTVDSDTDSNSENNNSSPLNEIANKYRQERENSKNEEDIPLMELRKRIRNNKPDIKQNENSDQSSSEQSSDDELFEPMQVENMEVKQKKKVTSRTTKVKNLLKIISDIL